jgi:hypothetical protein
MNDLDLMPGRVDTCGIGIRQRMPTMVASRV